MTVLSVAYPLLPVGPDSGGGAEQIVSLVEQGLVDAGHRSVVIAAKGSTTAGELVEGSVVAADITDDVRQDAQRMHLVCIEKALGRYAIDLIHFHGLDFYGYLPKQTVPMLATLHLPVSFYPAWIFDDARVKLSCVSYAQANSVPGARKPPVVSNGVDTGRYRGNSGKKEFLLVLTRICPEKGVHIALEVAHRLDLRLIIAGPVHPFRDHQIYFSERVQPLLDEKRQYVGPVGIDTKVALLAAARCVLIPSLVAETSSLVAMEAISSGTPVIAFRSGALPEVVEHGETGFIVDCQDQMMDAVQHTGQISPETCRSAAELRFDARRMVNNYLELYNRFLSVNSASARGRCRV
ncbi:MAG: glycosyltransferase family 4 protein [Bryobacteraceae bacterium]